MFRIKKNITKKIVAKLLTLGFISSCSSPQDIVYFQNAKDFETVVDIDSFTPRFKVNDILSINISAFDLEAVEPFNLTRVSSNGRSIEVDYLIDQNGFIDYPVLGKMKLIGLTIDEAKELFVKRLVDGKYLKDPIVNIRLLNFRVSVLGEVRRPGNYTISGERVTVLEALGLAGDLTIKGRRNNVMIIRDFNGARTYTRIDLTTKEALNSPVYYLTQNDVVYVEPNKSAAYGAVSDNRVSIAISIASILLTTTVVLLTR